MKLTVIVSITDHVNHIGTDIFKREDGKYFVLRTYPAGRPPEQHIVRTYKQARKIADGTQ